MNRATTRSQGTNGETMHARSIQPNPYAQLDAIHSAQRAAAKREAARVRKELLESASELAADSDFSDLAIMQAGEEKEFRRHPKPRSPQNARVGQNASGQESTDSEGAGTHISDWA